MLRSQHPQSVQFPCANELIKEQGAVGSKLVAMLQVKSKAVMWGNGASQASSAVVVVVTAAVVVVVAHSAQCEQSCPWSATSSQKKYER
mgnify:CR=1 FL=1